VIEVLQKSAYLKIPHKSCLVPVKGHISRKRFKKEETTELFKNIALIFYW
jgi:hypothetical protein